MGISVSDFLQNKDLSHIIPKLS